MKFRSASACPWFWPAAALQRFRTAGASLRFRALGIAALVLAGGCSSNERLPTYPVEAQLTFHGKPLGNAVLTLLPETPFVLPAAAKGKVAVAGKTDEHGKVRLQTYDAGDGAPAGKYRVGVICMEGYGPPGDDAVARGMVRDKFNGKYAEAAKSGLRLEVVSQPSKPNKPQKLELN